MERPLIPVSGYVRQARRRASLSQRELAELAGIRQSTLSRIEADRVVPSLPTVEKLLAAGGLQLTVVDDQGRFCPPLEELPDTRDGAERSWPAHLGLILDPEPGEWWGDRYGLVRPPETFHRDPEARRRHREVFTALRGVGAHSEPIDWRQRQDREQEQGRRTRERAAQLEAQRRLGEEQRRHWRRLSGIE